MTITFHVDDFLATKNCLHTHVATRNAIFSCASKINTYDLSFLSFDLMDLGYSIFISWNGVLKPMYPGMKMSSGKKLKATDNIRQMLIAKEFTKDFIKNQS